MPKSIEQLEKERVLLLNELTRVGDMRRGSITEVFRRCGKDNCACARSDHPGHGPFYAYTTKVQGKTKTLQLRSGPLLTKIESEVEEYKKFREATEKVVELSEQLCEAKPVADPTVEEKKRRLAGSYGGRSRRK